MENNKLSRFEEEHEKTFKKGFFHGYNQALDDLETLFNNNFDSKRTIIDKLNDNFDNKIQDWCYSPSSESSSPPELSLAEKS